MSGRTSPICPYCSRVNWDKHPGAKQIAEYLRQYPDGRTIRQMSTDLNIPWGAVKERVRRYALLGIIRAEGRRKRVGVPGVRAKIWVLNPAISFTLPAPRDQRRLRSIYLGRD